MRKVLLLAIALVVVGAACGDDDPGADGPSIQIADSPLGAIVADDAGNTLYLFDPDAQGTSVCYDQCADAWPPLLGEVGAGDGVESALLGTTSRDDGTTQATYNGWPLYYFAADQAAGDTNGQGRNDVWWVISASGDAIR